MYKLTVSNIINTMKYRRDCHDFLTQSGGIIFLLRDYMIMCSCQNYFL